MAYHTTGYARQTILTVTKGAYTHDYDIRDAIPGTDQAQIDDTEFARLTDGQYEKRRQDFIDYVYSQEEGLQTDCPDLTPGSVEWNPTQCPLSATGIPDNGPEEL